MVVTGCVCDTSIALCILHISYTTDDLQNLKSHLANINVPFMEYTNLTTIYGASDAISLHSPAGFRIDIHQLI